MGAQAGVPAGGPNGRGHAPISAPPSDPSQPSRKVQRFKLVVGVDNIDKKALADVAWKGVPDGLSRAEVWQLLLDYRPLMRERQQHVLQRKRQEYSEMRQNIYEASAAVSREADENQSPQARLDAEGLLLRQIRKDLPRLQVCFGQSRCPGEAVVQCKEVLRMMERVLFVWAVRQPASGYVQGIDGILLLLVLTFLADLLDCVPAALDVEALQRLSDEQLCDVEADCYWCVSKILSEILDHYTDGFPGIQRMALRLMDLVQRIDPPLARHLQDMDVDIFAVSVQWIGCLMVREMPVDACQRLWDTLIAESAQATRGDAGSGHGNAGFETLLLYFCVCMLASFSARLLAMDFEATTMFLSRLPTDSLGEPEVELLLGEAFVLKSLFLQAPNHLSSQELPGPR